MSFASHLKVVKWYGIPLVVYLEYPNKLDWQLRIPVQQNSFWECNKNLLEINTAFWLLILLLSCVFHKKVFLMNLGLGRWATAETNLFHFRPYLKFFKVNIENLSYLWSRWEFLLHNHPQIHAESSMIMYRIKCSWITLVWCVKCFVVIWNWPSLYTFSQQDSMGKRLCNIRILQNAIWSWFKAPTAILPMKFGVSCNGQ